MSEELAESSKLKEKVELALKNIEESNTASINTTDKDAKLKVDRVFMQE